MLPAPHAGTAHAGNGLAETACPQRLHDQEAVKRQKRWGGRGIGTVISRGDATAEPRSDAIVEAEETRQKIGRAHV